jgi:hypothetical protein
MNGSPVDLQDEDRWPENGACWASALSQVQDALRLLDESGAPPQIGAELDLAIQHLKDEISQLKGDSVLPDDFRQGRDRDCCDA